MDSSDGKPPALAPRAGTSERTRLDLERDRARALQSLQLACDPRRRAELERRIGEIDQVLLDRQ